ncbi:MAG: MFS transporter [Xanthomonadaceae bacterium]|nr:MFS transporter [Xanthomonadaceae bacterium]
MRRSIPDASPRMPRWLLATLILLGLSVLINYIDRGNLATASPLIKDELGLSTTQLGFLLTAFFIVYAPMQIVVGWLVDRFGAARVLLTGFIVWSVAMSLTGLAHGFAMLIVLRVLLGLGESVFYPASSSIVARCFPESQRGIANAVIMTGMACGPAFGIFFGGLLIAAYGWRPFFIGFGLVSLAWVIPWLAIAQRRLVERCAEDSGIPPATLVILRERSLWGAGLGHFCANYVWYFVLSWMPYYLVRERGWSLTQMAMIGGSAYLLMALTTMATGWDTDRRIASGSSPTLVRKSFMGAGMSLSAVFIVGSAVVTSAGTSALLFLLTGAAFGLVSPNIYAVAQSLAGASAAGRWMGIQNGIGNIAGLVAPFLTGVLVDRTGNFMLAFLIAAAMSVLGGLAWVFVVGPVRPIDWARRDRAPAAVTPMATAAD